jgi:hypothetical protein
VIVPAHDEEAGIGSTVQSLLGVDWPPERLRVVVVADNCSDRTAERAREAGALVLVRDEPGARGKGQALAYAINRLLPDGFADAFAVVDADSIVTPNLLAAFAQRIERGAGAVQASYGVRNPGASWRTRLMTVALALFHNLRSLGRERLGLSAGCRGNGWCVTRDTLARVPYAAFSVVEDVEYGLALGEAAVRVHHAHEAVVRGEMPIGGSGAITQRRRWEGGRRALVARHAPRLIAMGLLRRDKVRLDLAADLLVPTLTTLTLAIGLGLGLSAARGGPVAALAAWGASAGLLAVYVARGWWLSGSGGAGLLALALAPLYMVWKLTLFARPGPRHRGVWIRTARTTEVPVMTRSSEKQVSDRSVIPPADFHRVWAELVRRGCGSVALAPVPPFRSARAVAAGLAALARAHAAAADHGDGVRFVDAEGASLSEAVAAAEELRASRAAPPAMTVALVDPIGLGTGALPVALAADGVILVVGLGATARAGMAMALASVGPERVLGVVAVEGVS